MTSTISLSFNIEGHGGDGGGVDGLELWQRLLIPTTTALTPGKNVLYDL
jgi:hypothetical protein